MTFESRLKKIRRDKALTQAQIAKKLGISKVAVTHWESGETSPNGENLYALSKLLSCSVDWLLTGKPGTSEFLENGPSIKANVPIISSVQAGEWTDIAEVLEPHAFNKWIPTTIDVGPKAFALTVKGDSMTNPSGLPSIPEGMIVIVDPDTPADSGKIVIAQDDAVNEASIKKLVVDGPNVYLKPLNPNYDTLRLNKETGRIIGVVRAMYQEFES